MFVCVPWIKKIFYKINKKDVPNRFVVNASVIRPEDLRQATLHGPKYFGSEIC